MYSRPGVKYVFVFDSFHTTYLNYIEIRAYLYLYLIEKSVFVFAFLEKSVFDPSPDVFALFFTVLCLRCLKEICKNHHGDNIFVTK